MVCIHFHFFQHLLSRPLTFARLTRVCLISDHSKNIDLVFKHSQERQQVLHAGDNKICCVIVQGIPGYEVKATQQITTREKSTSQTGDTTEFANKPTHKCGNQAAHSSGCTVMIGGALDFECDHVYCELPVCTQQVFCELLVCTQRVFCKLLVCKRRVFCELLVRKQRVSSQQLPVHAEGPAAHDEVVTRSSTQAAAHASQRYKNTNLQQSMQVTSQSSNYERTVARLKLLRI